MLSQKETILAARLLQSASNQFANHGCNDWSFPENWSDHEKKDFMKHYLEYHHINEEPDPDRMPLPDCSVMEFLAHRMIDGAHEVVRKVHAKLGGEEAFKVATSLCDDAECSFCAEIFCPHHHELHFHHDGCPACAEDEVPND